MKAERVMFFRLHGHRDASRGFVPGDYGGQEHIEGCGWHGFGERERSGVHSCAEVDGSAAVSVVHFDGMRSRAVGHGGETRDSANASANYGRAAVSAGSFDHALHGGRGIFA
jgi:hypothetical protein